MRVNTHRVCEYAVRATDGDIFRGFECASHRSRRLPFPRNGGVAPTRREREQPPTGSGVDVAFEGMQNSGRPVMSRAAVAMAIEELLMDRQLRTRFTLAPVETVAELCLRGIDLNPDEFDLFCRTDACVWVVRDVEMDRWQH
jgi:hypothetical protein